MKHADKRLSPRTLTFTFLAVIMAMSILFSTVFFITSAQELDKRPAGDIKGTQFNDPDRELDEWIGRRSDASKANLAQHLILLNVIALILGTIISYSLARTALRPIERALSEQDRFISDASHELRTPITAALLSNEVALKNTSLTLADAKSVLVQNLDDMLSLKKITDELLDQTKSAQLHENLQEVALEDFVHETVASIQKVADNKAVTIMSTFQAKDATIYPRTLAKILMIILDNAIKYSPARTTVTISAATDENMLVLSVKDEGIGISKADQDRIFDRFYRSDLSRSQHEGYGLGLSIASELIAQMHGSINVVSRVGSGSTFTLKIPLQTATK